MRKFKVGDRVELVNIFTAPELGTIFDDSYEQNTVGNKGTITSICLKTPDHYPRICVNWGKAGEASYYSHNLKLLVATEDGLLEGNCVDE